jgi:hypothetical protein
MSQEVPQSVPESTVTPAPPRALVELRVGMKTFGTTHYMDMITTNLSATGVLLRVDNPKEMAPFQNKTLLEIIFYPDGKFIDREIKALGVVVRFIQTSGNEPRKEQFGVRIVDTSDGYDQLVGSVMGKTSAAA